MAYFCPKIIFLLICSIELIFCNFTTCDLDLPEELHKELPKGCENLTGEVKDLAIEESKKFQEWDEALTKYEQKHDPNWISPNIPEKQWELREKIQRLSNITECSVEPDSQSSYYECLIEKRESMMEMLNDA